MKDFFTWLLWNVITIVVLVALAFALKAIFWPAQQAIERETFEESKSYVHGKISELASYYEQYVKADYDDKAIIKNVIQMQFAQFDEKHIDNKKLRSFLIEVRGY